LKVKPGIWWSADAGEAVTPESLDPVQRHLQAAAQDFVDARLLPRMEEIESPDLALHRALLSEAGELGLLGVLVPEAYGGSGHGLLTAALVIERLAVGGGVGVSVTAHSGIGTLPIVLFGDERQRRRYLPVLADGRWIAAFALTEPGAGSDAMAIRCSAVRCPGGWRLHGQKQFITNAGLADLYTVFARVGDEGLAAFLVERASGGLALGPEERKMGLSGSSTRRLRLDGVFVPDGGLLGRPGRGQAVAFTVLHFTRFLMASGCLGLARRGLALATDYACTRRQFGRPLAAMGLVREKLAQMAVRIHGLESALYRLGGWLEQAGRDRAAFAAECSSLKVFGSEVTGFCADEAVQVHGGNGYMRGYEVERLYRDVRIQRIFEGTNEINRLIVARRMLRLARGLTPPPAAAPAAGEDGVERTVRAAKRLALDLACAAGRGAGVQGDGQEVLARVADAAIAAFVADSVLARARAQPSGRRSDLAALAVHWARDAVLLSAREVYGALLSPERARESYEAARAAMPEVVADPIAARARVAERLLGVAGLAARPEA
jgi:alkylation response protein AidB-like acyl-CoA dehydrogenase